jgi:polygalacturonase
VIKVPKRWYAASLATLLLAACGSGGSSSSSSTAANPSPASGASGYQVGLNPTDPNLPAAPTAPSGATQPTTYGKATYPQVTTCKITANYFSSGSPAIPTATAGSSTNVDQTLAASWASDSTIPTVLGMGTSSSKSASPTLSTTGLNVPDGYPTAPDTNRIQAALFACANATNAYDSTNDLASNGVVELAAGTGGQTAFVSGPLSMPGGVTLLIDKGVTLFASRDPVLYESGTTGAPTTNSATGNNLYGTPAYAASGAAASSTPLNGTYYCGQISPNDDGCIALISNVVYFGSAYKPSTILTSNNAVMGPGTIDGQGGQPLYSLMAGKTQSLTSGSGAALSWTPPPLLTRPSQSGGGAMSWWDIGWEGNEALSGEDQNNPRLIYPQFGYNFTLYNVTLQNAPKIHISPSGVSGFTAWAIRIFTPTKPYQSMTNYWGANYDYGSVKNTDGFDPAVKGTKSLTTPAAPAFIPASGAPYYSGSFTGDMSNVLLAYSYISDSDDDIAVKGESGSSTSISNDGAFYNMTVAHNHFFYGHGMSIGSQTSGGPAGGNPSAGVIANTTPLVYNATGAGNASLYPSVSNIKVYDLAMDYTDNGVRIKTNWSEGGLVSNISYTNVCLQADPSPSPEDTAPQSPIYIYPYYSAATDTQLYPSYQNITVDGLHDVGYPNGGAGPGNGPLTMYFEGFDSTSSQMPTSSGWSAPAVANVVNPLGLTLNNVVIDTPATYSASLANIALGSNVNLNAGTPLASSTANGVTVTASGSGTAATVDCSAAFSNISGNTDGSGNAISSPFPGQQFP